MIQLIPGSNDASTTDTFTLDQKKGAWQPTHAHLRTKSFPTPFAQAEMMSHLLGQLLLDPGAQQPQPELVNPRLQQSFERWRLLLLGLVLGELTLETVDLRRPEVDNLGAMLADLRPECRFLGLLRDARRQGAEGRRLLVGGADPMCLFWCAPRVARENYWSDLKTRIDASAERADALKLLAEWRGWYERNGLWSPGHESAPPWQKGLQVLLGETAPSTGALSSDARGVGPLRLSVVPRSGSEAGEVIAFLPQRDPGWGARFAELLFFQPIRSEAGTVDLVDPNGRPVVTVRMAPRDAARDSGSGRNSAGADTATTAGVELLAGVGRLEAIANVARGHGQAHWLEDHPNAQGYRSLVLNPLLAAAATSHRRAAITEADVLAFPMLFPDSVRLVVAQTAEAEAGGVRIHLSREVIARVEPGVAAPQSGSLLSRWTPGEAPPRIVAVPGGEGALAVGLVERFGPPARVVDVGELRALGFALWLYFLGEAELRSDGARVIWTADEGKELFGRVVLPNAERPLDVLRDSLLAVRSDPERARARDRLATLQRYAMTWRSMGDGESERPEVMCARLGRVAAESFLAWVMEGSGLVLGRFGQRAATPAEHYTLNGPFRLPLFVDPYVRGE